jgi:hypothetical protein
MRYTILIFVLVLMANSVNSQGLLNVELYGGPSVGFFTETITGPGEDEMSLFPAKGYHLGVSVLGKIADNWQLALQGEYLNRPVGIRQHFGDGNVTDNNNSMFGNNFGIFSYGARYLIPKEKFDLYFQPSLGMAFNRDAPDFFGGMSGDSREVHNNFLLRVEFGIKKYTKRNNYFLAGLRYQQGIGKLDEIQITPTNFNTNRIDFSSQASYAGIFVGFGINSDRLVNPRSGN